MSKKKINEYISNSHNIIGLISSVLRSRGHSYSEISDITGYSYRNIKTYIHFAEKDILHPVILRECKDTIENKLKKAL